MNLVYFRSLCTKLVSKQLDFIISIKPQLYCHWYYQSPFLLAWNHHERFYTKCPLSFWRSTPFPAINNDSKLGVPHTAPWSRHPSHQAPSQEQTPPGPAPGVWAWRPPWPDPPQLPPLGVGLKTPQPDPPKLPPGCGPGNLQGMLGYHPPWRPAARHAGIPPAMHAGIPPPCEQNDRQVQKYYLAPNFVCGR